MESTNLQSRKWLLTVNNPLDYGLNHAGIKNILHLFNPDYFCLVDEIATTGTRHTHIFIYSKSPIRFSTLKKRFPIAESLHGVLKAHHAKTDLVQFKPFPH